MSAYFYNADIYCQKCGDVIRAELIAAAVKEYTKTHGKEPEDNETALGFDPEEEHTYDSSDFPKGPYGDGGGESDSPQNCGNGAECLDATDSCGVFLENPLTEDGYKSVQEMLNGHGENLPPHAKEWAEFYSFTYHKNEWPHASDWLDHKLDYLMDSQDIPEGLKGYIAAMAETLDNDKIQDLFQGDMDDDGFFKESGWFSPEMND